MQNQFLYFFVVDDHPFCVVRGGIVEDLNRSKQRSQRNLFLDSADDCVKDQQLFRLKDLTLTLLDVNKLIQVEQHAAQTSQTIALRLGGDMLDGGLQFVVGRLPTKRQLIGQPRLSQSV